MRKRINKVNHTRSAIRVRYRNRVRQCRLRALVVSEAELSRRTGIERTTLSALENNRRFLSVEHALLIKETLGCSLDDLYEPILSMENSDTGNKVIPNANDISRSA
jgi:transcriptional regulator with XRE-family HTH domain